MYLIAIIVALVCEHLLSHLRRWRNYDWFGRYLAQGRRVVLIGRAWQSAWGLLFLVPPLLVIGLIQWSLDDGILGLVGFVYAILVLIFALGPRDLWEEVHELMRARQSARDDEATTIARELTTVAGAHPPDEPNGGEVVRAVLLQAHERVFAVLFWFFVLGPLGAAAYRLIAELPRHVAAGEGGAGFAGAAARLHAIAAWIPLRLFAVVYALAGGAESAFRGWRRAEASHHGWVEHGWHLLAETGCGALRMDEETDGRRVTLNETLDQALSLAWRSLIILLAAFAVLTIGGWLA